MLIYPAIDLQDGVCVRLAQGRFEGGLPAGDRQGRSPQPNRPEM